MHTTTTATAPDYACPIYTIETIASLFGGVKGDTAAPTGPSAYYRLTWTEPDGRAGRISGGRTLEGATAKAHEIDADLRRAAVPASLTTLGQIVTEYISRPGPQPQDPPGLGPGPPTTESAHPATLHPRVRAGTHPQPRSRA